VPAGSALGASKRYRAPHISSVRCWPPQTCGSSSHTVAPGGTLKFKGRGLRPGMIVLFAGRGKSKARAGSAAPRLRRSHSLVATVPAWARSGRVRVAWRGGRRSNAAGPIKIKRRTALPHVSGTGAFDGNGMWIWYVSKSSGGDPAAIAAQARAHAVRTVFVKSSDGTTWWPQFSTALVAGLKAQGLQVCAWQFVYGNHPAGEAALGARAASTGADCLVIDAESAYQKKYAQAQQYVQTLRQDVGPNYPLALSGFPYVDYHGSFPYSVFLGPGGAQANLPQIYWKAIGTSVDTAVAHTYLWNEVYQRAIYPLGQLYGDPSPSDIARFRQLTAARGATGVSWWSWQSASARGWNAVGAPVAPLAGPPSPTAYPALGRGAKGDVVVWAQQHLIAAGQSIKPDGVFSASMEQAVRSFQTQALLPVTGRLDAGTWPALLRYEPTVPAWSTAASKAPRSAHLRSRGNELRSVYGRR
jgi:Putative peptidoglycan binding domain